MKRILLAVCTVGATACASSSSTQNETKPATAEKPASSQPATAASAPEKKGPGTVVDIAVSNESFSTLVAAIKAAGLVEALSGEGPFTVFAPTDEAFAALPEGTVEGLLKPEAKDKLIRLLQHHVVSGKVGSSDVVNLSEATTLAGTTVAISAGDDGVMVGGAKVVKTDIMGSNGVIHVVGSVLLPEGM